MAGEEFNLRALERLLELPGLQMELELNSFMAGTLPQEDSHLVGVAMQERRWFVATCEL